jgi:hypothetical protein
MEVGDALGAASEGPKMKPVELQFKVESRRQGMTTKSSGVSIDQ